MLQLGQFNLLVVTDIRANGVMLDGGQARQVFMPLKPGDASYTPGEQVEVFIYLDSDGGLAATTSKPLVEMGQVAWLEVVEANQTGAFVDWGLPKDLFIPFAEQQYVCTRASAPWLKSTWTTRTALPVPPASITGSRTMPAVCRWGIKYHW